MTLHTISPPKNCVSRTLKSLQGKSNSIVATTPPPWNFPTTKLGSTNTFLPMKTMTAPMIHTAPTISACEKARRRDPTRYQYSSTICSDFRRGGGCPRGDDCEFAHGVFECWLHPTRYRTEACKDGKNCKRKVCFFAHSSRELRLLPESQPPYKTPTRTITIAACFAGRLHRRRRCPQQVLSWVYLNSRDPHPCHRLYLP
ncbi:hypothetical protein V6Z11_1Z136700 [Gossypium hirsutum]